MPQDYNTGVAVMPAAPIPTLLFMGRPSRKTLIIAGASTGVTLVSTSEGNFTTKLFARIAPGTTQSFPLKDYGPLITGEIWVSSTLAGVTINGAEIFDVGKARK